MKNIDLKIGTVDGYPTTLISKIYQTNESISYSASNIEFGEGVVTFFGKLGATFQDKNHNLHKFSL